MKQRSWLFLIATVLALNTIGCKSDVGFTFDPESVRAASTQPTALAIQATGETVGAFIPGAAAIGSLLAGAWAIAHGFKKTTKAGVK